MKTFELSIVASMFRNNSQTPCEKFDSESVEVDNFLTDDVFTYKFKGEEVKVGGGLDCYISCCESESKQDDRNGLILISDTVGWKSGRIRHICDYFGEVFGMSAVTNFHFIDEDGKLYE